MDVLGLLWYVFYFYFYLFIFCGLLSAFSFFWVGDLGYERGEG